MIEEYEKALRAEAEPGVPRWFAWTIAIYAAASLIVSVTITATVLVWFFSQ